MPWWGASSATQPASPIPDASGLSTSSGAWELAQSLSWQAWQQVAPVSAMVQGMVRDGLDKVSEFTSSLLSAPNTSRVVQKAQDHYDRGQAYLRWSGPVVVYPHRVPHAPALDQRMLVSALSLAKVLHDQATQHNGSLEFLAQRPVTVALVAVNLGSFLKPGGVLLRDVCLSPYCVVERGEWHRLIIPAFVHLDLTHLLCNLSACLPDCVHLEESSGSVVFAAELAGLTVGSHLYYVLWAWEQKKILNSKQDYYSVGALGFSSVAFAMNVVAGERSSNRSFLVGGFYIPSRYVWALQLALNQLCAPESSFPGHICGVIAGLTVVYVVDPVLHLLQIRYSNPWADEYNGPGPQTRFYGAGTTGGRVIVTDSNARSSRAAWWRNWALSLASQLGMVLLATGVYAIARSRTSSRQPVNHWKW